MTRKNLLLLMPFLIGIGLLSSCKKDKDDDNNKTPEKTCYISKVYENSVLAADYTYNGSNQINEASAYTASGKKDYYIKYNYSGGKVTGATLYGDNGLGRETFTITYNTNGKISKLQRVELGSGTKTSTEYEYNAQGQLSKSTQYQDGNLIDFKKYTVDAHGSVTKVETFADSGNPEPDLLFSEEYTYDDKVNGISYFIDLVRLTEYHLMMANPAMGPHNITRYIMKDNAGNLLKDESFKVDYTYTEKNLPKTIVVTFDTGENRDFTFEYDCK